MASSSAWTIELVPLPPTLSTQSLQSLHKPWAVGCKLRPELAKGHVAGSANALSPSVLEHAAAADFRVVGNNGRRRCIPMQTCDLIRSASPDRDKLQRMHDMTLPGAAAAAMRILVIDGDPETADYLASSFRRAGQHVESAADGHRGLMIAVTSTYDVIILDRDLPGIDGLSVVKTLRQTGTATPILFLTSLGTVNDRVAGLEAGADDYLLKPFDFSELMARVRALARRPPIQAQQTTLRVADLEVNLISRTVIRAGRVIDLLPREFELLVLLMRNEGRVLTRTMLLERIWDFHFDPKTSVVETHVSRLRMKIDRTYPTRLIHTVRGRGYSLYPPS